VRSPFKKSHDGHKISMGDCEPSPNKAKIHHKSQSDLSNDMINIGFDGPSSALVKKSKELGENQIEGFTFDKTR